MYIYLETSPSLSSVKKIKKKEREKEGYLTMFSTSTSTPKIAVIGAGIAGLPLAYTLHKSRIPFTLYESDTSLLSCQQSSPVNIHYNHGEKVLRSLGLFSLYTEKLVTSGCEVNTFGDQHGRNFLHHSYADETFYPVPTHHSWIALQFGVCYLTHYLTTQ
jgi:monoamine oxidase